MRIATRFLPTVTFTLFSFLFAGSAWAQSESMDQLYKKALTEGGTVNFYGTLAQINAEKILPVFEKTFPGIKVNHVDATSDRLVTRAIAEARGGKVIGDILQVNLIDAVQAYKNNLLAEQSLPEAKEYPEGLKGSFWLASDLDIYLGGWNTNLVKKEEEPTDFEDFGHPRWKNRLIGEPRDLDILVGMAKYKYKSDEKAIALIKRIAANNPEFHRGHSQLVELLIAGQAAACFTCYSHHFPARIQKGAPLNYMMTEGVASIGTTAIFKNAPHPNTAILFARWITSRAGQKAMSVGGRTIAHPEVEPAEKVRPAKIYPISATDIQEYPRYEKIWKEIFKLR